LKYILLFFFKERLALNPHNQSKRFRFYIIFTIVLLTTFTGGFYATVFSSGNLIANVSQSELLDLNSLNTQLLNINGHLNAISLIDGQIVVFEPQNELRNWVETQRFCPKDIVFTTFQVKDFNNDGIAEIIAGTMEPGFIYIYKLTNGKWELFNCGKYVWSTVTYIAVGNFGSEPGNDILVQNQEGSLYLLKLGENSLDLVWKSPTVWKQISSGYVLDIDHDAKDEVVVAYKNGGIGIIKLASNSAVSVWENYLWGKVMAVTFGDLDHDGQPEILFSTSQKVIYDLGWSLEGGYQFKKQWTELNYIVEKLAFFTQQGQTEILATDTAGRSHLLQYDAKNQVWLEDYTAVTGRIAQIINNDADKFLLWGYNRKLITMQTYATNEIKLNYQGSDYSISPAAIFRKELLYVAPKALQEIADLNMTYQNNKTTYTITRGDQTIEIAKKDLTMKANGNRLTDANLPIVVEGELQLPLISYQSLFKLNLSFDSLKKVITIYDVTN
jgi:hypothetical protein